MAKCVIVLFLLVTFRNHNREVKGRAFCRFAFWIQRRGCWFVPRSLSCKNIGRPSLFQSGTWKSANNANILVWSEGDVKLSGRSRVRGRGERSRISCKEVIVRGACTYNWGLIHIMFREILNPWSPIPYVVLEKLKFLNYWMILCI